VDGASHSPILQLHTTRHCNLFCRHCYSDSGPKARETLSATLIDPVIADAVSLGYRVLNLSGGEPLIDPNVRRWIEAARAAGMQTQLVTNGMLVTADLARWIARDVDLVAVSIDGPPPRHNALRGSAAAFEGMERGVDLLAQAGARFGLIHTAREETLADLRWLFGWAAAKGAALVQLHPLERGGRAKDMASDALDEGGFETRLALLADLIAEDFPSITMQCDAAVVGQTAGSCGRPAEELMAEAADLPFAALVNPLVVEPDGMVMPLTYGLDRRLALGSLKEAPLMALAAQFRKAGLARLLEHQRAVSEALEEDVTWPFVAWHAALAARPLGFRDARAG
jgi:MoaA/NifB/PqqE/SkfB family radical SAM enzyme